MNKLIVFFATLMLMVGCVPPSAPVIELPAKGGIYVGYHNAPPPIETKARLPQQIKITYSMRPSALDVYLNGQPISDKFAVGLYEATANFADVKEFLKQGGNTLSVNPYSMGPTTTFVFDNRGPEVIIDKVTCSDGDCQTVNGGMVTVDVSVIDPSNITSVNLQANAYAWEGGFDATKPTFKTGTIITGVTYPMSNIGANKFRATIPESTMYTFVANDDNGYSATTDYLSEGQKVNSVFKLRIGKSLLDSMVPIIEPLIDNMHQYSPKAMDDYGKTYPSDPNAMASDILDNMNRWWASDAIFYGRTDMGASTANQSDCGYVDSDIPLGQANFTCSSIKTDVKTGAKYCLQDDVDINASRSADSKEGRCTRIVVWRLKLDDMSNLAFTLSDSVSGRLFLNAQLNDSADAGSEALNTDLGIRHIKCGTRYPTASYCTSKLPNWLGGGCIGNEDGVAVSAAGVPTNTMTHAPKYYCRDDGGASAALGIVQLGDLKVTATSGNPSGFVDVNVFNGALALGIDKANIKLNLVGLTIGSWLDGFISFLSGLLDGLFVDIVGDVIRQNMTDFRLGFDIFTESGSTLRMQSQAYQVYTNADNNPATPTEWYMFYAGFLKPLVPHPDVPSPLGTYFKRNDVTIPYDDPSISGDNFSIGISSNIINQGLASIYRSGMMHFTVSNFKKDGGPNVLFGPDASVGATGLQNGDARVVLIPKSPAIFEMIEGTSGTQASLQYQGATMDIEIYDAGVWKKLFHAKVNIKAGVLMTVVNKKFHMTIDGNPKLEILELLDLSLSGSGTKGTFSGSFGVIVSKVFLESAINLVIQYAIPMVAESNLVIDVPDIPGPLGSTVITSTENIQANGGQHLGFSMGFNLQK